MWLFLGGAFSVTLAQNYGTTHFSSTDITQCGKDSKNEGVDVSTKFDEVLPDFECDKKKGEAKKNCEKQARVKAAYEKYQEDYKDKGISQMEEDLSDLRKELNKLQDELTKLQEDNTSNPYSETSQESAKKNEIDSKEDQMDAKNKLIVEVKEKLRSTSGACVREAEDDLQDQILKALGERTQSYNITQRLSVGQESKWALLDDDPKTGEKSFLGRVIRLMAQVTGTLAVLLLITGAVLMIVSRGSDSLLTMGKNMVIYTLGGVVLVFASYIIVQFVISLLFFVG